MCFKHTSLVQTVFLAQAAWYYLALLGRIANCLQQIYYTCSCGETLQSSLILGEVFMLPIEVCWR